MTVDHTSYNYVTVRVNTSLVHTSNSITSIAQIVRNSINNIKLIFAGFVDHT